MNAVKRAILVGTLFLSAMIACTPHRSWVSGKGSYSRIGVDKTVWGDFELELRMERSLFAKGDPIRVLLVFRNAGDKTIRLDGILPMRASANPPTIEVTTPDGGRFRSYLDGIPAELLADKPIVIEPGETVTLIDADLRSLSGSVHPPGGEGRPGTFGERLQEGTYQIWGRFQPTPQIYWSRTGPLEFGIR